MSNNPLKKAIDAANSGQRFPVMSLVRQDPSLAAVISKLIPDQYNPPQYGHDGNRTAPTPDYAALKSVSEKVSQSKTDAQTIMQLLPDMELSAQILVSSIISPKDMNTMELVYSFAEGLLPSEVGAAMIGRVKQHFQQDYKIEPLLSTMLRDILFEAGSYPVAVIPENSIDEAINGSGRITMEALSAEINRDGTIKPRGILGPVVKEKPTLDNTRPALSLESFTSYKNPAQIDGLVRFETSLQTPVGDSYLSVTDNPNLLKIPQINQKLRQERILQNIGSRAMESLSTRLNDRELTNKIYKDGNFAYKPISTLKTQEQLNRRTVGSPLVLHLPSESVIPVHVPGSPEQQIGFFVLIDGDGNPVSKASNTDYYQELQARLNQNGSFPSAMLSKVKSMMNGFDISNRNHLDYSTRAYAQMVEQDLLARLRNGVYGNGVAISHKEEVYRIMLSRALAKQHTQLLFLPVELMTYFAFRYDDNGVGKSLLDDMQILNSLRAMVMFANVMSSLRNSIGRTEVKLKLDESDPDPKKTIEIAMHEITRTRQQYFPLGMNSPTDLVDWLQRSGFEFTFEGHPGLPDVSVDFGEKNTNYVKPDSELEESLRKRAIMATGLSPETVDNSFSAEFATTVVSNNLLLAKRVTQIQEQFTPQLADHMRKVMLNSEKLLEELREIVAGNFDKLKLERVEDADDSAKKDQRLQQVSEGVAKNQMINRFLMDFILSFEVSLPKPNSITLENQLAALKTYIEGLDMTLESWLSDKFFTSETGGDISGQVESVREMVKAHFIRQWMSENGVLTELSALTATDTEGKPTLDLYAAQKAHIEALTKSLTALMVGLQKVKDASDAVLADRVGEVEAAEPTGSDDSDAGGGSGDDDLGGGMPDFSIDDAGGDAPPEGEADGGEADATAEADANPDADAPAEPKADDADAPKE